MRWTKHPFARVCMALWLLVLIGTAAAQTCTEGDCWGGTGTYKFASGSIYSGQFKNGRQHGQGTYIYANGERHVGEYRDGQAHGQGVHTWPNGDRYVGEIANDSITGLGIRYKANGIVKRGVHINGQFVEALSEEEFNARVRAKNPPPVVAQVPPPAPVRQVDPIEAERKQIAEEKARLVRERDAQVLLEKERRELAEERKRMEVEQAKAQKLRKKEEREQLLEERARLKREKLELVKGSRKSGEPVPSVRPGVPDNRRVALIIGNSSYVAGPLKNPVNDAEDVAAALKRLGFEVILRKNADLKTMDQAVDDFYDSLRKGGVGLFYFAGHGVQVQGTNYLIPVDAQIKSESDVRFKSVDAGRVLGKMEDAGNGLNLVILDACRNNPFTRSFRSASQGLAKMDAPTGSLIAYSTAPGSVAADGKGRNGVYTKYLLQVMAQPDLPVEEVFKRVRLGVVDETRKTQVPWEASSLTGYFYFNKQQ